MTTRRELYRAMVVHDPAAVAVSWRVRALAERMGTRVTAVEFRVGERVWRWGDSDHPSGRADRLK